MKMNKTLISTMLAISAFGFAANANALNADAEAACPGCHGVVINGIQAVGSGGGKACSQRTVAEWVNTINRMNGKGCGAQNVSGIANYLASVGNTPPPTAAPTTTTTTATAAPTTTTTATAAPTTTTATTAPTTATTATTAPTTATTAPTTATTAPTTATTAPTTATVATTTTTTMMSGCNTYVNGTTQYKYSGKGLCHSFAEDLITGAHIVRDEAYCQKHMEHSNSKGNHVHTYPHPTCM